MSEQTGREAPHRLFTELADALAGGMLPAAFLSSDLLREILQSQRLLFQRYQETIRRQGTDGAPADGALTDHQREAVKALMSCYLEMAQLTRAYQDSVLDAQSKFVARYVDLLDELLRDHRKPEA